MRRFLAAVYGSLAYLAFLLPIGYLVGFLADMGVPKSVDRGAGPLGPALLTDLALLLAFGLQHSVMARPGFKRRIQRWVPTSLERSTYVLASGLTLALLFWLWRPIPAVLWDVSGTPLGALAWTGFATGWALAVWATFALSHLHLFGVSQVVAHVRGQDPPELALRDSLLYRIVRHPMTAGLVLVFWSSPRMTLGHLVFAAGMTVYSLAATVLEERDLLSSFPDRYRSYRRRVPALVPILRPGWLAPRGWALGSEILVLAGLLTLVSGLALRGALIPAAEAGPRPVLQHTDLVLDGVDRSYAVYDPGSDGAGPRPLVLALHGTGGSARRLSTFLGGELERISGERGWLVAYPEAYGAAWNDCRLRAGSEARAAGVDDLSFLKAVVAREVSARDADPERVFVLGYSGGGHMAFRVALEAPDLARGIAVFGASLPVEGDTVCNERDGAVSILLVNGVLDPVSPFDGGDVITPTGVALGRVRSFKETAAFFDRRAGGRAEVALVALERGGHTVPGRSSNFPKAAGPTDRSFQGAREAVEFFARQSSRTSTEKSASR